MTPSPAVCGCSLSERDCGVPDPVPTSKLPKSSDPAVILKQLTIVPVHFTVARAVLVAHHYLHSIAAGTQLCFGVFVRNSLMGAITLGAGPFLAYQLVDQAGQNDCLTLTRFWLDDRLPRNSESKALGILLKALKTNTRLKFLVSYADPTLGHVGTIYEATNWVYTGLSQATPVYSLGDGKLHHSRSLAHAFGTHSVPYLKELMVPIGVVIQPGKHRYLYFLDPSWRSRLLAPVLPYPKKVTP